uniref:Leucine-rich repeat domain, L domain-containing protein n=1 Tax=Strongyloides papillosus TaxID=174720 RepID=A0A0N5BG39_STREA
MSDKCDYNSQEKPQLMELTVASVKVSNNNADKIEVKYIIDPESKQVIPSLLSFQPIHITFNKMEDYENFLKLFDFSRLLILNFYINSNTDVIRLFNKYNTVPNSLFSLSVSDPGVSNANDSKDILNLITNIKNSNEVHLGLNFPLQQFPEDFTFPVMKSLKVINIKELNGTQFLNRRIISHLIDTCPDLRSFRISAKNKGIYYEIMKLLFARQALSVVCGCKNISFDAHFSMERDLSPITVYFYRSLFEDKHFEVSSLCFPIDNNKLGYSFHGSKKCYSCGREHVVNVLFEIES